MGFLSNLIDAGLDGTKNAVTAFGRGADDLAHGDWDSFINESENTFNGLADIPGTPFSALRALYDGANGDLSWNPYSQENSVWDQAAGGAASNDPNNRRWGRTIGTLIGSYFTGGLLGNAMGSSAAGGAASGALWGAGQAAGYGGDSSDVARAAVRGGISGGAGSYIEGLDAAGNLGVTNPTYGSVLNRTLSGGLTTALTPGADSSDIARGAVYNGIQGLGPMFSGSSEANPYAMEFNADNNSFQPANRSTAPWANQSSLGAITNTAAPSSPAPWAPSWQGGGTQTPQNSFSNVLDQVYNVLGNVGINRGNSGQLIEGLAGLYQANRQRKQAKDLMAMIGGRRDAYGAQLRRQLERRDAASGRRSDYAGRETQLQAGLAELDSRNAPGMMQLSNLENLSRLGMLQSGLRLGGKMGWLNSGFNPGAPQMTSDFSPMSLPQIYQGQEQLDTQHDPYNWERSRRLDQFGA